jgi:hypothetical protein
LLEQMSLLIKRSELFEACRIADFDVVEEVLTTKDKERHAAAMHDLHNYREHKTGLTPFLLSSSNTHNSDLVVLLYKHGAKLDQTGLHHETCLHLAARHAREDVLDKLLRMLNDDPALKKRLIDKCDDEGSTPIMCACFAGDIPCMRLLREHGAFLDKRNYRGQTPLIKSVCFRNNRVVDWLLSAQVDTLLRDNEGRQASDYAKERGLDGMVEKISGKTITDELDMWIDEHAHLTGATGNHQRDAIVVKQPSLAEQMVQAVRDVEALAYEESQLTEFSSTYSSDGPSYSSTNNTMGESYSYTPPAPDDPNDPYQMYEQWQIDEKWQEFTDYENDCAYWFNNLTNESTYERPWCLGGPVERMDKNVATAKAAVFKSMLSTAVTSPTKEESVNNDNAEGKKEENIITHDVEELEGNESNESNESKNNKK